MKQISVGIVLTVLSFYALSGSRERPWGDADVMYQVAESVALRGTVAIHKEWPPQSRRGADGRIYSQYPLLPSLVQVPTVWLQRVILRFAPKSAGFVTPLTSHLSPALLGAIACLFFFLVCLQLNITKPVASLATVVLAAGTMVWVYARSPFAEALQTCCFMGFLWQALRVMKGRGERRDALLLGVSAGVLLSSKLVFAFSLLGCAIVFAVHLRNQKRALFRLAIWGGIGFLPFLVGILLYNAARWGSPFDSGYGSTLKHANESLLFGLWGLLLSPGKSFFLYSPPLIVALFGLRTLFIKQRWPALLLGASVVAPILFYAQFLIWSGGYCWGPRYLTFAIPVVMLGFAYLLQHLREKHGALSRRLLWGVFGSSLLIGAWVQVLGNGLYWDHYIRIARQAKESWLGQPNRRGAATRMSSQGHCNACFEDMHAILWLPPFEPITGHAWLLKHLLAGHDWQAAEADAPWHRHTRLQLGIARSYSRARIDWWGLLWLNDYKRYRVAGVTLLITWTGLLLLGIFLWRRSLKEAQ